MCLTSNVYLKFAIRLDNLLSELKFKVPFYLSADIRDSGFKIAPVDVNLFPAGFNNISADKQKLASQFVRNRYENLKFLLITENFTRNDSYFNNINVIKDILLNANCQIECACFVSEKKVLENKLVIKNLRRKENYLYVDNYIPDIILLNNDLISGYPEILWNIKQQIIPNVNLGWFRRSKFEYFKIYNHLVVNLCKKFGLNDFFFSTEIDYCDNLDFKKKVGLENLAFKVENMLKNLVQKYKFYNINKKPYVVVKSDNGTFGMSVAFFNNSQDILNLNKKLIKKLNNNKFSTVVNKVIIQEAVPTIDLKDQSKAEIISYSMLGNVLEYFYRYVEGSEKSDYCNLNTTGAKFYTLQGILSKKKITLLDVVSKLCILAAIEEDKYN